ncbi:MULTISPECIES: hypothetical protein [unclassified Janthinobacterium]|uniref:hypothetical protein n=1 Tax=unclassified Janthinobacterium TaxID=2610881 RepID=UPI00160F1AC3|nr:MULTISPECIES: hypothetical protein [unclassified Janthinobacterium]MBB5368562.1 hypothetical protein [Janthinobacterium sp. K2C7]MBB5381902.1 hypothetical protein [Janthinobacterium sp. K2Li3]MBB5386944.1 hypothetical protein [Janthinobacterium sp. K2E3]
MGLQLKDRPPIGDGDADLIYSIDNFKIKLIKGGLMIIKLKIALFFMFYCFFCSIEASQLVGGRCTIFFDENSNNESVNTLLEKYKSSSVQLCRNDEESRYYVYSAPYMTSKDICFVRNIDAGVIKGDSYQSFFKDDSKNNEDEIHQLFSLSKSDYCEKITAAMCR